MEWNDLLLIIIGIVLILIIIILLWEGGCGKEVVGRRLCYRVKSKDIGEED